MALCEKACCNAAARKAEQDAADAVKAEKLAAFEAWLRARDAEAVAALPSASAENDLSYEAAVAVLHTTEA